MSITNGLNNTTIVTALITAFVTIIGGYFVNHYNFKAETVKANANNEGIYATEFPELLEKLKKLTDERNDLSVQLTSIQAENKLLRQEVESLTQKIDDLTTHIKEETHEN